MSSESLARWLAELPAEQLRELLERRPDGLIEPAPLTLAELAGRWQTPFSVAAALSTMPRPCLQLAEVVAAFGEEATVSRVVAMVAQEHAGAVPRILAQLARYAIVWPSSGDGERLGTPFGLAEVFDRPLGLDPPIRRLIEHIPVRELREIQQHLGLAAEKNRPATVESLVGFLADPGNVRGVLAGADPRSAQLLDRYVWGGTDDDPFIPAEVRYRRQALSWAHDRGLLFGGGAWYEGQFMPAEVALALRGPGWHAPFDPIRPQPAVHVRDEARAESASAAAATQFEATALAVLDHLARHRVATVKSGGVGVRELTRLARATSAGEADVRLVLELATHAGLLRVDEHGVAVSPDFAQWRTEDPADRLADLLLAWWSYGGVPSRTRDEDGKALRPLMIVADCPSCRAARVGLIAAAGELEPTQGSDRGSLANVTLWSTAVLDLLAEDGEDHLATHWREAESLGVLAVGGVSRLGRLLLSGDSELVEHAASLLPPTSDRAKFGADLTALVAGAPSARVSALLDSCADRESRGGAVLWRFSNGSIRRAMDDGATGDGLEGELTAVATSALPQPLTYLLHDLARRHGSLRVSPALSCIRSADEALLAEVAADRKLARLHLRPLAPTVLASDADTDTALGALRGAGYLPMPEDLAGNVISLRRPGLVAPRGQAHDFAPAGAIEGLAAEGLAAEDLAFLRALEDGLDPDQDLRPDGELGQFDPLFDDGFRLADAADVADRLSNGSSVPSSQEPSSVTEQRLRQTGARVSPSEIRMLAYAIDQGTPVGIVYRSGSGAITRRVIRSPELNDGLLVAWCELRSDERMFALDRISAVYPAG